MSTPILIDLYLSVCSIVTIYRCTSYNHIKSDIFGTVGMYVWSEASRYSKLVWISERVLIWGERTSLGSPNGTTTRQNGENSDRTREGRTASGSGCSGESAALSSVRCLPILERLRDARPGPPVERTLRYHASRVLSSRFESTESRSGAFRVSLRRLWGPRPCRTLF